MARSRKSVLRKQEARWGYLMLAPTLVIALVFFYFAIGASLLISFTDWTSLSKPSWVGLRNYLNFFTDRQIYKSFWNTLRFTLLYVPSVILVGFLLALLLNSGVRLRNTYRLLYFLPRLTLPVALALVWKWIFDYKFGLLNHILGRLGTPDINWLGDPAWAMLSIVFMSVWIGAGYGMVIFIAGLQNIPQQYYEAATMDGANGVQKLFHITVPMMTPTLFFMLITTTIYSFQVFDQIFVMTQGGPKSSTRSLMFSIYEEGFRFYRLSSAAAVAWVLFLVIFIITVIQFKMQKKWVYYT